MKPAVIGSWLRTIVIGIIDSDRCTFTASAWQPRVIGSVLSLSVQELAVKVHHSQFVATTGSDIRF